MTGSSPAGAVEFVCTGNICRSPFAAGVAIALGLPPDQVHSSGLWADPGRGCPPEAITAAAEFGVDLSHHGARRTAGASLEQRDWILAMEFRQLAEVKNLAPAIQEGRATLLGVFVPGAGVEIPDPYGRSAEGYRVAYGLIHEAVGQWLEDRKADS